jgi:glutaminyl-tRNA synthetase
MAVLDPLKLVITNYPEDKTEELDAVNNPEDETMGNRKIPFSKVLYIEKNDFAEDPPPKYFRLAPGREVRLKHAYYVTCTDVIKDEQTDEILEVHCTYDPQTRGGWSDDGRKVKGTIHWVSAAHAFDAKVRLYDHLFKEKGPDNDGKSNDMILNENSLITLHSCKLEPCLREVKGGDIFQFERIGYFCVDNKDSSPGHPVFNRIVTLRDSWKKIRNRQKQ